MKRAALVGALVLVGCAGPSSAPDEAGEEEAAAPAGPAAAGWSVAVRRAASDGKVLEFEVASPDPIPARAADPVLLVGAVELREYRYSQPNVVVFSTTDVAALPDTGELALGWATGQKPPVRATRLGRFDKRSALSADRPQAAPR
jgi:hypothetical protein